MIIYFISFSFLFLIVLFKIIYSKMSIKQISNYIQDEELNRITNELPDNIQICNKLLIQNDIQNVKIKLNENVNSPNSFYNVFNNTIILCNNEKANKSFARVLFIAHECWHSKQDKKHLWLNFILGNISILYFVITSILIITNVIPDSMYFAFLSIYLIICLFRFFARIVIESDATYMSIILAVKYLRKYINERYIAEIEERYKKIISDGFSTFCFSIIFTNLICILIYILEILLKTYI